MSNSFRHTAIVCQGPLAKLHGYSTKATERRRANKTIRRIPVTETITNGGEFKKHYESFDICEHKCDFRFMDPNDIAIIHHVFMK